MKFIAMYKMGSVGLISTHDTICCNLIHSLHSSVFLNYFHTNAALSCLYLRKIFTSPVF